MILIRIAHPIRVMLLEKFSIAQKGRYISRTRNAIANPYTNEISLVIVFRRKNVNSMKMLIEYN